MHNTFYVNYKAYLCEDFLILVSRNYGFKFFYNNKEVGEINLNILNTKNFYVEKGSLFISGNLSFCLKWNKHTKLLKMNKKTTNFREDDTYFYYEFKNIKEIKMTASKTSFCLSNKGTEALNAILSTNNQKPLTSTNYKQRNVVIGYEIKTQQDFVKFLHVSTIASVLNKFGFNYKVVPIVLNLSLRHKAAIRLSKFNYIMNNASTVKTTFIDKQNHFCINLPHHIFKFNLQKGVLNILGGGVQFGIIGENKIKDYSFIGNTLILSKGNYYIEFDSCVCINNVSDIYDKVFNYQNDFCYLFRQIENKKLFLTSEVLNKMLSSIKRHIKNRTRLKLIAKQLFCLCGYTTDEKQKLGLLRLACLLGKLTERDIDNSCDSCYTV